MSISEVLFTQIEHTTSLSQANTVYIHEVRYVLQLRLVFQTWIPISLVIIVISIQDLYMKMYKYKYRVLYVSMLILSCTCTISGVPEATKTL